MSRLFRTLPVIVALLLVLGVLLSPRPVRRDVDRDAAAPAASVSLPEVPVSETATATERRETTSVQEITDVVPASTSSVERTVHATLPEVYAEGLVVECQGARIRQTLLGGSASAPSAEAGMTLYREVLPGVDAQIEQESDRVEEYLRIRPLAASRFQYRMTIESSGYRFRNGTDLEVVDDRDVSSLRLNDLAYWTSGTKEGEEHLASSEIHLVTDQTALVTVSIPEEHQSQEILLDPGWSYTGSMKTKRFWHTGTRLADGRVIVTGGKANTDNCIRSCEIYDPATARWTTTGSLLTARRTHSAVLLPNGKVLVVGGIGPKNSSGGLVTCELFNPATGTWSYTGSLPGKAPSGPQMTVLPSGTVFAYFYSFATYRSYDPATGTWSTLASSIDATRTHGITTGLADGRILLAGGRFGPNGSDLLASCEIYDPATNSWSITGSMTYPRTSSANILMPDGRVLMAGGWPSYDMVTGQSTQEVAAWNYEIYDSATGMWTTKRLPFEQGGAPGAVVLNDGTIWAGAGVYTPSTDSWVSAPPLQTARNFRTVNGLLTGKILVAGGISPTSIDVYTTCELYTP